MFSGNNTALVIEIIIGVSTILVGIGGAIRWLTKHYFDEIKSEFKPNGGSSLKDQVNRLERNQAALQERIDKAEETRKEMNEKLDQMYLILLKHIEKTGK